MNPRWGEAQVEQQLLTIDGIIAHHLPSSVADIDYDRDNP